MNGKCLLVIFDPTAMEVFPREATDYTQKTQIQQS